MKIIAGLGNPGPKYANNRHNAGFMAADAIARRHSFSPWARKFNAEVSEGVLNGEKIVLLKPQTYMNNSGQAVGEAMRFFKLSAEDLVVFYDELDLAPGKIRIKTGGGHGGHNGIRSIDAHCGSQYRRVRIGIGHPGDKALVHNWVLGDFAKADGAWVVPLMDAIADNAAMIADGDDSGFMNKVALATGKGSGSDMAVRKPKQEDRPAPKEQSHIRQARPPKPTAKVPDSGPMAEMLKKLFSKKD